MLGRPAISEGADKYDARELGARAVWLSSPAWKSGRLVAAPRRKRKARVGEQDRQGRKGKRQKKANGREWGVLRGINSAGPHQAICFLW